MKIFSYSTRSFEQPYLKAANKFAYDVVSTEEPLSVSTVPLAKGCDGIMVFTGDDVSAPVLEALHTAGIKYINTRAAGYDNIDLTAAAKHGIRVSHVPAYSPYAIAEHAVALLLALNRKLIRSDKQVHQYNFTVGDLVGFDLHGRTVGIIGTGTIGSVMVRILHGFGCKILAYDTVACKELVQNYDVLYRDLATLCRQSDIISIHLPLNKESRHLVNKELIAAMKPGVIFINTSRGAVVNTTDVIEGLRSKKIGAYGADVYEKEKGVFFFDRSESIPEDAELAQLLEMENVLLTPHQGFATTDALTNIADASFQNLTAFATHGTCANELKCSVAATETANVGNM